MDNRAYVVVLTPRTGSNKTCIRFSNLRERLKFLELINASDLNATINLFEEIKEENKDE